MTAPYVHKLFTGKVKVADPMNRSWKSGMFKEIVDGDQWLSKTGFTGDEVADKKNHGGPEKAVFAYPESHYSYWQEQLEIETIDAGGMGENLSLVHADEYSVCIGDTYRFGESIIQVAQPRKPCWKPARRFNVKDLAVRIQTTGRTGWYFRVLKEGRASAGQQLHLIERPYPQWTIAVCNEVTHEMKDDLKRAAELVSCELLAENWKKSLNKRLANTTKI
ncbi:MOSC domain-containing protein [Virgibacillus kekensis]|uniref:MOSC domain-containing protein n=1 Tax=Virgibacillus kekensis TaxID=202261 RepID=A0ABV9DKT5_9BACI